MKRVQCVLVEPVVLEVEVVPLVDVPLVDVPPLPSALPLDVADQTRQKYVDAYERLTGRAFDDYLRSA